MDKKTFSTFIRSPISSVINASVAVQSSSGIFTKYRHSTRTGRRL
jgi:hypothetical protein